MIKAVLFDYGGVLCRGGGVGSVRHMLAGALAIDEDAVQDMDETTRKAMTGDISAEGFIDELLAKHPGAKRPTVERMLSYTKIFDSAPEVYALAERLRANGIQTGILSNMVAFSAEEIKRRRLFDGFKPLLLSCELHMMKPDPAFYQVAIRELKLPAGEILFIDDRPEMTAGAERVGMQTLLARNPQQTADDTAKLVREQTGITL